MVLVVFLGPDFFFSEQPTMLAPGSAQALVEALAVGALLARALEAEALAAFAEAKGRLCSSSNPSEEEEGGAATHCFFLESFTGVEVSGLGASLLPRVEGGSEVQSAVRLLGARCELSSQRLSGSSSQLL